MKLTDEHEAGRMKVNTTSLAESRLGTRQVETKKHEVRGDGRNLTHMSGFIVQTR